MMFKTKNLNYAFNVEYYDGYKGDDRGEEELKKRNRALTEIETGGWQQEIKSKHKYSFDLQTAYPGLLVGIGNAHEAGETGEIKLGFTFDYVTGAPYIPGSSIKGVLRSAFAHEDYIDELLGNKGINVKDLENEIFEGKKKNAESEYDYIPVPLRDTFYDSFPADKGRLIAIETITPHGTITEKLNPLTLVKVKPDVTFRFNFKLHDSEINGQELTAQKKLELFKKIIIDLGLGAKTNVGFGVFTASEAKPAVPKKDKNRKKTQEADGTRCENCGAKINGDDVKVQICKWSTGKWLCESCRNEQDKKRRK